MTLAATVTALVAAGLNASAAAYAGWRWWRVEPDAWSWWLIRSGQAAILALALVAAAAWLAGERPEDGLFWVYAFVPLGTSLFAEQFRILSAQTVLDARGLDEARAVGRLPEAEQRSIVLQIARRELGVMALAAAVNAFLALRAVTEASGF
ncbi:MAG TPA: hypothetical protein VGR12_05495 [Solirubrobacteraceae bacterium]|nr:hypothetical protein [Solirubrobacteraceae bacterium]